MRAVLAALQADAHTPRSRATASSKAHTPRSWMPDSPRTPRIPPIATILTGSKPMAPLTGGPVQESAYLPSTSPDELAIYKEMQLDAPHACDLARIVPNSATTPRTSPLGRADLSPGEAALSLPGREAAYLTSGPSVVWGPKDAEDVGAHELHQVD